MKSASAQCAGRLSAHISVTGALLAGALLGGCQSTFGGLDDSAENVISGVITRVQIASDGDYPVAVRISEVHLSSSNVMYDSLDVFVQADTKIYCAQSNGSLSLGNPECFSIGALVKAQITGVLRKSLPGQVEATIIEVRQSAGDS